MRGTALRLFGKPWESLPHSVSVTGSGPGSDTLLLTRARVLVVEDDYFIASEFASSLRRAGAKVLGPCADAVAAMRTLNLFSPNCAVLDVHLSDGIRFGIAAALKAGGIPVVYATGYDPSVIPAHLTQGAIVLRKPVHSAQLVRAVALSLLTVTKNS